MKSAARRNKFLWVVLSIILFISMTGVGWAADEDEPCTIMHPDRQTRLKWIHDYETAPEAYIDNSLGGKLKGSLSLLSHLNYVPADRNQGYCGNCWAWAGTGVMEIALDVDESVFERLSVQYNNSCGGTGTDFGCCGGWLEDLADFYTAEGFAIPWANTNAEWQDGSRSCGGSTAESCASIGTSPNYPITSISETSITTHGVGQATAIANIKNVLNQGKAVWFGFFLALNSDWTNFRNFWNNQGEGVTWNPDFSCGHTWDPYYGGGHAVLCVGYNDDDPANPYWIMVNSWGTASGGRPNGIFHLDMDMNYDCYYNDGGSSYYSFYWQSLNIEYDVAPVHACCNTGGPGCIDSAIQTAVCAVDSFCCEYGWDAYCVSEVTSVAGDSCDCCNSHSDATGCYVSEAPSSQREDVSECVCQVDSYCCDTNWDSICSSEVESLGCGICPDSCPIPNMATNPYPANYDSYVKLDSILSWSCSLADSFEDQSLSEYTSTGGTFVITTAAAHDGFYGLEIDGSAWSYRDDAAALVAQGETISFWVRPQTVSGRAYLGFGASAAGTYSAIVAPNTSSFVLQLNDGYSYVDLASVAYTWSDQWYRVEVQWGAGGQITARLFDQDGTSLLRTVSAVDNTYSSGGIAFRAFGGIKFIDTAQVCPSPVPGVAAISEALKARFSNSRDAAASASAPQAQEDMVWDEANQGYTSPDAIAPKPSTAPSRTVVPEGYSFKEGMLVEGQTEPAVPNTDGAAPSETPVLGNASSQSIYFDDVTAPCNFADTTRLTTQYASLGVIFAGPGGNDGGAILNECGGFGVSGHSSPNFLAFNSSAALSDGGIPQGPETIFFATPVSEVQASVGSGYSTGNVTIAAYNPANVVVDTATVTLSATMQPIAVAGENIVRVVVSSSAAVFVLDNLTWAQWCEISHDVFFGTTNPPTNKVCSDILGTFCNPGTLVQNTTYYWQVVTKSPGGTTPGFVWQFNANEANPCECDLNHDGKCDMQDWLKFGEDWGRTDCYDPPPCECDLNRDGKCDMQDWLKFGEDWGRTNCPVASCEPQVCGQYTFDCNPQNSNCACYKTAEGYGSCGHDYSCTSLDPCTDSSDCASGDICAVETCCGGGVCMPKDDCAPGSPSEPAISAGDGSPTTTGR